MAKATTCKGEWEEDKHPRDHGRFSSSEGAQGSEHEDHKDRANEDRAVAAGHISPAAREIADKYVAAHQNRQIRVAEHAAALDDLHKHAAEALAALHEYSSDSHKELSFEHSGLHGSFNDTQNALDGSRIAEYVSGGQRRETPLDPNEDVIPGYVPHPDDMPGFEHASRDEYNRQAAAHEAWAKEATAKYDAEFAAHHAEFQRRADVAQTALEQLHERQVSAHADLKAIDRTGAKEQSDAIRALDRMLPEKQVNEAAFAHHERDSQGEIKDENAAADHAAAHDAAESMHEHATGRVAAHEHNDLGDALESLKEETKSTRDALRDLGKITGRAPRLPAKPKKSANRPANDPGASVWGMATPTRYKLKLTKLDFLSLVDTPAQETAAIRLVKRKGAPEEMEATLHARVVKWTEGDDPLLYCWAFTCTDENGQPYHDLQGDAITPDFIKAAEAFMAAGGAVDEMHDGEQKSKIAFAYPMDPDIAKAMLGEAAGAAVKQSGLMVAIRPTTEQLAKVRSGDYTGVSIAGTGIRELVKAGTANPKRNPYSQNDADADDDEKKDGSGEKKKTKRVSQRAVFALKAVWSTAYIDQLPDSAFLHIEGGGSKDSEGKTTPRSLRHFPYKDASGKVDIDHLRDATGRIPQSSLPEALKHTLQVKAEKLLAAQHDKAAKRVSKADQGGESTVVATSETAGHQHTIDLDDPADGWQDQLTTSFNTAEGATNGHSHGWVFDPATGKVTILADSGHSHTVGAVVPADTIRQAQLNESGERCPNCGEMCDADCKFCPMCGCAMDGDSTAVTDGDDDKTPQIVLISARAPAAISPHPTATPTVKSDKEPTAMADTDRIKTLEAENAQLKKIASLTDAQRTHFSKLDEGDATNFLNMNHSQRNEVLAEIAKADEVVYESPYTKRVYRKSSPLEVVEAAREADASKAAREQLDIAKRELEFTKRGETVLKNWPIGAKRDLRARIMKALDLEFKEAAEHEEAVKAFKGADFAFEQLTIAKGINPNVDPSDAPATPQAQLDALAAEYAKANNIPIRKAFAAVLDTPAGAALYAKLPTVRA